MAGKSKLVVDAAPFRTFAVAYAVAAALVVIAIIVGATGPTPTVSSVSYVYDCENNSHVWSPEHCIGTEPDYNKDIVTVTSEGMNKLNRFWIVEVSPYNKNWTKGSKNVYKMVKFTITANLSYSSTLHGTWHPEEQNVVHTVRAACPLVTRSAQYSGECQSFSLAFEKTIDHKYHRLDFRIAFDKAAAPEFELGDIEFVLHWGSRSFSKFEIGFTAAYVLLSLAALAFFVAATRRRTAPYSFEQIALLVLLVCAVLYDNPLFMVEYASFSVVLYKVVDSVFKSVFISAVLLFWLFTVERLASERDSSSSVVFLQKAHIPKYAAVLAYFVLSIITFSWAGAVEASDPLLFASATSSSAGLMAFYVLTALVLIGTVLWVAVSAIRSIHVISSDELMFKRFCFFVIPSIFVAGCMIVCSFTGSFGAVVRTPFEIVFFLTTYNAYLWVLIYGYLPSSFVKAFGIESSYSKTPANDNEFKEGKRSVVYNDDDDDDDDGENSSISEGTAILSNTDKI